MKWLSCVVIIIILLVILLVFIKREKGNEEKTDPTANLNNKEAQKMRIKMTKSKLFDFQISQSFRGRK